MRRLAASLARDAKVQFRSGFLAASLGLAGGWLAAWRTWDTPAFPPVLLGAVCLATFAAAAAQLIQEMREGSLASLDATPLRPLEYLASKVATSVTLPALGIAAAVGLFREGRVEFLPLLAGLASAGTLSALLGFLAASLRPSFPGVLAPSILAALACLPPILPWIGLRGSGWYRLHPLQAPLSLLEAAFAPVQAWEAAYGAGYSILSAAAALVLCKRAFARLRRS